MIPTRVANTSWRPYLIISLLVGVFVYLFGEKVGAPFMWFVYADVGIGIGDAGYWVLLTFILLKLGEILLIGRSDDPAHARKEITNAGVGYDNSALEITGLLDVFKELVRTIWVSLEAGAKNTLVVSCIAGVLGILLSAATQSDLPGRVSQLLVDASFGLLPLTIFWVIVAGYIVGMGLPIVASYVILAIFAVGALAELGVPPIAAHMISYWVAVVSAVTPPVALAAYAASSIALSDPVKTGNQALKQASMILITPFLFVYTPLLLDSTLLDISISVAAITAGVFCWAKFLDGWGIGRPVPFERLIWLFCALCLLMPTGELIAWIVGSEEGFNYHMYALGALVMGAMFIYQMGGKDQPAAP